MEVQGLSPGCGACSSPVCPLCSLGKSASPQIQNPPLMHVRNQRCPPSSVRHPLSEPRGRVPGSREGAGHSSAKQAALHSAQGRQQQPGGARTSQGWDLSHPPSSTLTCSLDFFLAFSTDLTVSPAADRAAIRDSMSDICRGRKKKTHTDGDQRIHQQLRLLSLTGQSSSRSQALTSLSACCT